MEITVADKHIYILHLFLTSLPINYISVGIKRLAHVNCELIVGECQNETILTIALEDHITHLARKIYKNVLLHYK